MIEITEKQKETTNKTSLALQYLYFNSLEMQMQKNVQCLKARDRLAHAKEYGTITMQTARRTGHSCAIADLFNYLDGNWIVLSPNMQMSEKLQRKCKTRISDKASKTSKNRIEYTDLTVFFRSMHILRPSHTNLDAMNGIRLNGVIVDGAFALKNKEVVYKKLLPFMVCNKCHFFIFVQ